MVKDNVKVDFNNNLNIVSCQFSDNIAVNSPTIYGSYKSDANVPKGLYYDAIDELFDGVHGGEITLDKDYTLTHGPIVLEITDNFTINGNGKTINANNNSVFSFISFVSNFTFKDITLYNSPIVAQFTHYPSIDSVLYLNNTNFHHNGQVISSDFYKTYIYNSTFRDNDLSNNSANAMLTAVITVCGSTPIYVYNSTFIGNKGIIFTVCNGKVYAHNSIFKDNYALKRASLANEIYFYENNIVENNSAYADPLATKVTGNYTNSTPNPTLNDFKYTVNGSVVTFNKGNYAILGSLSFNSTTAPKLIEIGKLQ